MVTYHSWRMTELTVKVQRRHMDVRETRWSKTSARNKGVESLTSKPLRDQNLIGVLKIA